MNTYLNDENFKKFLNWTLEDRIRFYYGVSGKFPSCLCSISQEPQGVVVTPEIEDMMTFVEDVKIKKVNGEFIDHLFNLVEKKLKEKGNDYILNALERERIERGICPIPMLKFS